MSRPAFISALIISLCLTASTALYAQQHYVAEQPVRPHATTRPQAPRQGYVWIEEDWRWAGGKYLWAGDRWTAPPYQGAGWAKGHWKKNEHGWYWNPGHWTSSY
jgi:hypothetical protein